MSAAFTSGPWDLIEYPDGEAFEVEGGGCIMALVHYNEGAWTAFPEAKANASLIAAAPELYASLVGLLIALNSGGPFPHEAIDRANAACRKARGEQ